MSPFQRHQVIGRTKARGTPSERETPAERHSCFSRFFSLFFQICSNNPPSYQNALDQKSEVTDAELVEDVDPRLTDIVERMFKRTKADKEWLPGLGIAIEAKRLDMVKDFLLSSPDLFGRGLFRRNRCREFVIGLQRRGLQERWHSWCGSSCCRGHVWS